MSSLEDISNRRVMNILRQQVSQALSHMLFDNIDTKECSDQATSVISNLLNSTYQAGIIDDYNVSEPSFPTGKQLTRIVCFNKGKRRPVYAANILLSDLGCYTIKTSRSLRIVKTALKKFDTTGFFVCDINIKPIEAPEFITLNIKANRNA